MGANNPHHHGAGLYKLNLSLPLISSIRRQEARAVSALIEKFAGERKRALEIGPGTGFYTLALAQAFERVVVIEDSACMARLLSERLLATEIKNVKIVEGDFLKLPLENSYDVVVAIGVLDYVAKPEKFVAKMCSLARQAVILTVPHRGLWGRCFATAGRLRGVKVYCYDHETTRQWAPGWRYTIAEVGLKTHFTNGLTLVAALEPI